MTDNILYDHVFRFLHLCSCYFLYTIAPSFTPTSLLYEFLEKPHMTKNSTLNHANPSSKLVD